MSDQPNKGGRPVEWTPERKAAAWTYICEQIAMGRSLLKICAEPEMPAYSTAMEWRIESGFAEKYARAREDQADHYADEIIGIADTEEDPNRARVRVDARKWVASKLKPKNYGEKVAHTGADGEGPVAMAVTWLTAAPNES